MKTRACGVKIARARSRVPSRITASALCLLAAFATVSAEEWTVLRERERDYVSFANVAKFYQFPEYNRVSSSVSLRAPQRVIRAQAGSSELFINGIRFFTSFPLLTRGDQDLIAASDVAKIVEPILRPSRITGTAPVETVVLDPGHGGTDSGASNAWGTEKAFTLDVALRAAEALRREGFKVEMTRSQDVGVSLEDRVALANKFPRGVFVCIHFNTSNGGNGIESYALSPAGAPSNASTENHSASSDVQAHDGNASDAANIALTAAIHAVAVTRIGMNDRGVRHARFHVLRDVKIPAVLVEGGFLSDPVEGPRIATAAFRQQLADAIAQGVKTYNAAVNYRNNAATFASAKLDLPPHRKSITEPLRPEPAIP